MPLTGDASDRRYFRIIPADGPSIVLALHAGAIEFATLPFANVAELLRLVPLPVPLVLGHSDPLGILALQDLGDVTLQAHLGADSPSQHAALYREAVALIETLQRRGAELRAERYLPYQVAFDVEKLTWELEFFVKYFILGYRGVALTRPERSALLEEWTAIVEELAAEPRVLCHRDYHSRNLMLSDDSLYIIDFQDARMGPDTYDLASLLRDSYVDIADRELDDLIAYFLALKGDADGEGIPAAVRSDGAAAKPESARHLRLSDDHAPQSGLHPIHAADASLRPIESRPVSAGSAVCGNCSAPTSRNSGSPPLPRPAPAVRRFGAVRWCSGLWQNGSSGCRRTCIANSALAAISCWRLRRTGSRPSSSSRRRGMWSPRIRQRSRTFNSGWRKRGST